MAMTNFETKQLNQPDLPFENNADPVAVQPLPPDEQFWEKYSRNFEFPLSSFGSIAAHVMVVGLFLLFVKFMNSDRDKVSPPIRAMVVGDGEAKGDGTSGSGGGNPNEASQSEPMEPVPPVPEEQLKEIQSNVVEWAPDLKLDPETVKMLANSPEFDKFKQLNDDLRKRLLEGLKRDKGKGNQLGKGNDGSEGTGQTGKGDAETAGERSLRWDLIFQDYKRGSEYLEQIAELKGKIIYPLPPNWERCVVLSDFRPGAKGQETDLKSITEMYYICSDPRQVDVIVDALEMKQAPPYYVLLLPKEVEDHLSALETSFKNRKSSEIRQTTFKFVKRDGKLVPIVVRQTYR
jgi:hypothetical protein